MRTRADVGVILLAAAVLASLQRFRSTLLGDDSLVVVGRHGNTTRSPTKRATTFDWTNGTVTVDCGRHYAPSCGECTAENKPNHCRGDCAWSSADRSCRPKPPPAVRLASSDSSVVENCTFFYVRVPKTGSTSIHNTIVGDDGARRAICSQKKHVPAPWLDERHRVGTFLVTVRDPYERFVSQYRYMYGNTAHASKALQLRFIAKYPNINELVSNLDDARFYTNALYWRSMTHYVPLDWLAGNRGRVKFLCASSNATTLHEQLEGAIGVRIRGVPARHNPTEGTVRGATADFAALSGKSRNVLAETFLRSDLELYNRSGCLAI